MLPLMLSLCWLGLGMLIGALANAAKLRPAAWARRGWMVVLGIGALVALLGGWLGAALLGLAFVWPIAVWYAVSSFSLLPRLIAWWSTRRRAYRQPRPI